ncbi:translocation/assembly module TamB domain-containing protein [Ovoidimarina sediminis]|uniref:translocation/assembly module TamB domain-containing protein n=1 Tax=Ovoidimarina sediminis TaxID=3079856 RepID=UPI002912A638|nr:translocation/assembly module TamB domain-containing protein [Rhodophyticola sp. MJ-SS7]MDU8942628.1 translocation/assembly module TamB domain-containing protein [Rhodophyticola sp. MJ-SS7]
MRWLGIFLLGWMLAGPVAAQGFLEGTLEEALSGEGRIVEVEGFEGALSSTARLDRMTIADDAGVWLTLEDVELDWNRSALLRGRVEVEHLRAAEIVIARPPNAAEGGAPPAEASGFSLPELPVSIEVGEISAARVELGAPVIGVAVDLSLEGMLSLEGGEGAGRIAAERIDGARGTFLVEGSYSNETRVLALDLTVDEGANGIVATLANLPGRPSLELTVAGEGPAAEFGADLRLATDGEDRLTGRVQLSRQGENGLDTGFLAEVSGDVSPLFLPEYQAFFGRDVALTLSGAKRADGVLSLSEFALKGAQLELRGGLVIDADGLPLAIDVAGEIAARDGTPVLLPAAGPPTRVGRVDLDISYDRAAGDRWTGEVAVEALDREGFAAERLTLNGNGRIEAEPVALVTAELDLSAEALDFGDAATKEALGQAVTGRMSLGWRADNPLEISALSLRGESYEIAGAATVTFEEAGPRIVTDLSASAENLANFAGLAGRPLTGAIDADLKADVTPAAGFIDATLAGTGRGLGIGIAEVDRLLGEETVLDLAVRRNETGSYLDRLETQSVAAEISARGRINSEGGAATATARLVDTGVIAEGVPGPIDLSLEAEGAGELWQIALELDGAALSSTSNLTADLSGDVPRVSGTARLRADDVAPFSPRVGREIGGGVNLAVTGFADADLAAFRADVTGTVTDLKTGVAEADALLTGPVEVALEGGRDAEGFAVPRLTIRGEALVAEGSGTYREDGSGDVTARVTLPEPGRVAPGLPGPVSLAGRVAGGPTLWEVEADLTGEGATAQADLQVTLGEGAPAAEGTLRADVADLSPFSEIAGRSLGGALDLRAAGSARADLSAFDVEAELGGESLRTGIAEVDALLRGTLTAVLDAARAGEVIEISTARVETAALQATAEGQVGREANALTFDARLADIARYVPGVSGPATASGRVEQAAGGDWTLDVSVEGPGGVAADIEGTASEAFDALDLAVRGAAPLAIANRFIAPRAVTGTARFDLAVNGPPALQSVSGQVRVADARAVAPTLGVTLTGIDATVALSGARANLDVTGAFAERGRLAVAGGIGLTGPLPSDLEIRLIGAGLRDPELYETTVDGTVRIDGPLAGGATISGALRLNETEITVPSGGVGAVGSLPDIVHVGEPRDVRATRRRAGLIGTPGSGGASDGGGPAYPLDLRIDAPARIFVRGRGIEAELGGSILVRGTTANVIPAGEFELIRGRLDILGKRLTMDEGRATLQGDFDPVVRLVASTQADDTRILIIVDGPASAPDILFESNPSLPEDEVIARLLFNRGIDTLSPLQAAQLASAVATLAGRGGGGIVSRLRQSTGLDDLDVAGDGEGGTNVRAGKYISDNIYTDVTVGNQNTSVSINLDLTPSLTVRGTTESTGGTGVGIFFERDY